MEDLTIATATVTVLETSSAATPTGKDNVPIPIIPAVMVGSSSWNLEFLILFDINRLALFSSS